MYTGQFATISNRGTWPSPICELVDDQNGTTTDLTDPALTVDIVVTISALPDGCCDVFSSGPTVALVTASIANGKVMVPGPGFWWQFEDTDLSRLCAGTYKLGVKVTIDGFVADIIIGTIAVLEGN
jgi:hypothetical protein